MSTAHEQRLDIEPNVRGAFRVCARVCEFQKLARSTTTTRHLLEQASRLLQRPLERRWPFAVAFFRAGLFVQLPVQRQWVGDASERHGHRRDNRGEVRATVKLLGVSTAVPGGHGLFLREALRCWYVAGSGWGLIQSVLVAGVMFNEFKRVIGW